MILWVVVIVAIAVLAIWVLQPLVRPRPLDSAATDPELNQLLEAKEAVLRSLKDLEQDRSVDKVDGASYEAMKRQYEAEAVRILRRLDHHEPHVGAIDLLEREIEEARRRLRKPDG